MKLPCDLQLQCGVTQDPLHMGPAVMLDALCLAMQNIECHAGWACEYIQWHWPGSRGAPLLHASCNDEWCIPPSAPSLIIFAGRDAVVNLQHHACHCGWQTKVCTLSNRITQQCKLAGKAVRYVSEEDTAVSGPTTSAKQASQR